MFIELLQKSLNSDCNNYEDLLQSLVVTKTTLECDSNGKIKKSIGYDIIQKLFKSGYVGNKPIEWFDYEIKEDKIFIYSCFKDKKLYYYKLNDCKNKCETTYSKWKPEKTCCINDVLNMIDKCSHKLKTFKEISNAFSFYLAHDTLDKNFIDIISTIDAFCDLLKQRLYLDKILKKNIISIFDQ
ncbi:hypothetical protein Indivirus_1_44 [Indivirus ILV1]|uniref:Uncharacterized protein n=1 Tax=Indivirus ILV1 TaxID=1977633 RepID=A0A1V0SCJ9_9VIRU|nr:hypothetical protein Indivirus_1_44 [Indivirus ILV1]